MNGWTNAKHAMIRKNSISDTFSILRHARPRNVPTRMAIAKQKPKPRPMVTGEWHQPQSAATSISNLSRHHDQCFVS